MKVNDIISLIDDDTLIWISTKGGGRWTMPKEYLIASDGDEEIIKIEVDSIVEKRRGKSDSITLYV